MVSKTTIALVAGIAAVMAGGMASGEPIAGTLRINSGSGGTSASTTFTDWDPINNQWYTWTNYQNMYWFPGNDGAYSTTELASASLSSSFASWNMHSGGWVDGGSTAIISGSATRQFDSSCEAHSWASVSFTNTTSWYFFAQVTGSASVSLRGAAAFDVGAGQSLAVWLPAGDYSISLDATNNGSFSASIPAPGSMMLGAASGLLAARRRRANA